MSTHTPSGTHTTPDEKFLLAKHPERPHVTIAAGFSGQGFKFVPVVGEIIADLALEGTTRHPIDLFAVKRERLGDTFSRHW